MFKTRRYLYKNLLFKWANETLNVKIQTKQRYVRLIKTHFLPYFDDILTKNMNINTFTEFIKHENDNQVSISVQKTLKYILKSSWEYGVSINVCKPLMFDCIKFKKNKTKIVVFTKKEQLILEKCLKNKINNRKLAILISLYGGLRIGEVCALKWKDIDLTNETILVEKTIIRIEKNNNSKKSKTMLVESTPKSDTSERLVPIPSFLIKILKQYKQDDNCYVVNGKQKKYDPRQLADTYYRILKKCGIKRVKYHTLRHTFATRCIESKMDIKTLSEILGHSSVEITLQIYVHPSNDLKKKSIENMARFVAKKSS